MALIIKKVVELSTLGDEYTGVQLIFRSIPAKDLPGIDEKISSLPKNEDGNPQTGDILPVFLDILGKYFISGSQASESISKEDIQELDARALTYCFEIMTGQAIDPKDNSSSMNTSITDQPPAEK